MRANAKEFARVSGNFVGLDVAEGVWSMLLGWRLERNPLDCFGLFWWRGEGQSELGIACDRHCK